MLREDPNVRAQGACTDTRYRRVVDYLRELRAESDLEYARAIKAEEQVPQLDEEDHSALTVCMDRRYLYDARRLIEAYQALWNRPTVNPAQLLMDVEESRTIPQEPLWENPVYLRDLADSLMGPSGSCDLIAGFETRDSERFEAGVKQLKTLCSHIESMNVLMLPIYLMDESEPDWGQVAEQGFKERTTQWRAFCDTCDDLAAIVLYRLQDRGEEVRAQSAACLLQQSITDYCELILPLFEQEIERMLEQEEQENMQARGEEEGGAVHVDIAA